VLIRELYAIGLPRIHSTREGPDTGMEFEEGQGDSASGRVCFAVRPFGKRLVRVRVW